VKWYFKLAGVVLAILLVWGGVRLYRSYVLAREDAMRAEARRIVVQDSVRIVFEEQQREISAAQNRITELTVLTIEIEADLEEAQGEVDQVFVEVEAALPDSLKHLAQQLKEGFDQERREWYRLVDTKNQYIFQQNKIIMAQSIMLRADTAVIEALRTEAENWKKAANSSFKFNVGSTVVTGVIGVGLGAGLALLAGS